MSMGGGGGGACAVCKHQRRKCEPNCELAAYFPASRMGDFRALHLVFGVANLTKLIKANATHAARRRAADTLTWEARWRERDAAEGCYREVAALRRDNAALRADNAALRRRAAHCSCAAAAAAAATLPPSLFSAYNAHGYGGLVVGGGYNGNGNGGPAPASAAQAMICYAAQDGRYRAVANGGAGVPKPGGPIGGQVDSRDKNDGR